MREARQGVQDQLRTLIREARELVDDVDEATLNRRPDDDAWSIAECLDHLNETARLYLPEFADHIEAARADGLLARPGSGQRTLLGRVVVWAIEPPPKFRTRTFADLEPARHHDPADLVDDFEALHEELIVRINEAADLDWKKVRIRSQLDRRLKLSLGDWFHFMAAHVRRHLWQARQTQAKLRGA